MEPISIIVNALVAGASAALKETASEAIKGTYQRLKALVIQHWKSRSEADTQTKEIEAKIEAKLFFENLEHDPASFQKPLANKLNEIMPEPEAALIDQAQQLEKLLKEAGYFPGVNIITVGNNNKNTQIGNCNTITINK